MAGDDLRHMRDALALAERARGWTFPNPMVGCVIVKGGKRIAEGYHRRAGQPHAEVLALKQAGRRAKGATVYVTLEPCAHTGRTPPCADALIAAGVGKVVIPLRDPNKRVSGRGIKALRHAGIEVVVGVLRAEAQRQNEAFLHSVRHQRPFVVAKIAQSLDGKVATAKGESQWITSPPARRLGRRLRHTNDAILVGVGTVLADNPRLTVRQRGTRDPLRVVLDSRLQTPANARVIGDDGRCLIICDETAQAQKRTPLERAGAQVVAVSRDRGGLLLPEVLDQLDRREVRSLLVEGGAKIMGSFFAAGLVNKIYCFIAPRLLGGKGRSALEGIGFAPLDAAPILRSIEVQSIGADLMLTGYLS